MKYTISQFRKEFGSEDTCLEYIFKAKFPDAKQYYRVKGRKCWAHSMTGHQIHPLAGTIFAKSSTPLTVWFEAIFLFSISKNGVSAKELQRHFGFTYKTAWRIGHEIRKLMTQDKNPLTGTVEADETYLGGSRRTTSYKKMKTMVVGVAQRGGAVRAHALKDRSEKRAIEQIVPYVYKNLRKGSTLYTDYARVYNTLKGYKRGRVMHSWKEYVRDDIHTNTIEGFWGQMKRSIGGTYHFVSAKHLQAYVNEFVFRYNHRFSPCFQTLVARAAR